MGSMIEWSVSRAGRPPTIASMDSNRRKGSRIGAAVAGLLVLACLGPGVALGATAALVKDINVGTDDSSPSQFRSIEGTLYFQADDGTHGNELWKSDGTAAGTRLVRDIAAGLADSNPYGFRGMGDEVFFSASDPVHGKELWKTDGTAAGTRMVKDINPNGGS